MKKEIDFDLDFKTSNVMVVSILHPATYTKILQIVLALKWNNSLKELLLLTHWYINLKIFSSELNYQSIQTKGTSFKEMFH